LLLHKPKIPELRNIGEFTLYFTSAHIAISSMQGIISPDELFNKMVDNCCEDIENLITKYYLSKQYSKFFNIVNIDLKTQNPLNKKEHFDIGNFYLEHIGSFMKENNYIRLIAR
jgi:hypothetical protein